jgi:competence protein ComEC
VVDVGRVGTRTRAGARAGVWTGERTGVRTWPVGRPWRRWDRTWPQAEFAIPSRLREWAIIEVGAGRLLPWFAVAFGAGIVVYFAAEHEPAWWAATPLAVVTAIAAILLRRRPVAFVLALGVFAAAGGFAVATLKTALIDHPLLRYPGIMAQTPQDLNPRPS